MTAFKGLITVLIYLAPLQFVLAKDVGLNEAYQREFIYLTNQKNNLKDSKAKTLKELTSEMQKLENEVESKLTKLKNLENKNQSLDEEYKLFQDLIAKNESHERKIQSLALQSSETLKTFGFQINDQDEAPVVLKNSFTLAQKLLESIDSVKKSEKQIFDQSGKKIKTDVYQFGLISSMAVDSENGQDDKEFGLLAPAGLGELKVIEKSNQFDPFVLESGKKQKYFLYDSLNKPFEVRAEKSVVDILEAGGLIGYVIVAFGLFALFVAARRYYILSFYTFKETDKHEFIKSIHLARASDSDDSKNLRNKWEKNPSFKKLWPALSPKMTESLATESETMILSLESKISAYGPVLMAIAAVAPLLGLLGTVTGMIATFDVITEIGTGNPKLLSGGISEALVTTKFGLIVAIPCLLLGNWLNAWAKRIVKDLYEIHDATVEEPNL